MISEYDVVSGVGQRGGSAGGKGERGTDETPLTWTLSATPISLAPKAIQLVLRTMLMAYHLFRVYHFPSIFTPSHLLDGRFFILDLY